MNSINEATVLNFYLEQMDKDSIVFLQNKEEYKSTIKKAIISIRDEKNMNKKIQSAKVLWKNLFETSMSYIDPDKRGYDELFKYFDEYVDFEELVFASEAFYRDHTMHCLWVYFLGEYVKRQEEFNFIFNPMNSQYKSHLKVKSQIEELNWQDRIPGLYKVFSDTVNCHNNVESIRCVSALTHDLGYPLKKINKINRSIGRILPYFSISNFNEFNFQYSNIQDNYIRDFLETLSTGLYVVGEELNDYDEDYDIFKDAFDVEKDGDLTGINVDKIKMLDKKQFSKLLKLMTVKNHLIKEVSKHIRYSNDFETLQHGIMSAFLLMKLLKAFSNIDIQYITYNDIRKIDFVRWISKNEILTAVSDHTSEGYKINAIRDPSSFLTLIDELEEFSRISRANQNRQFVNEFCKSNIYIEDSYLNIDFIFDNSSIDNLDPEKAFKGRCVRFLTLFDIPELDEKLKIRLRCIGRLSYDTNVYMLEIRKNFADITINDEEQSIPKYLKSRQFYTREEYMNK